MSGAQMRCMHRLCFLSNQRRQLWMALFTTSIAKRQRCLGLPCFDLEPGPKICPTPALLRNTPHGCSVAWSSARTPSVWTGRVGLWRLQEPLCPGLCSCPQMSSQCHSSPGHPGLQRRQTRSESLFSVYLCCSGVWKVGGNRERELQTWPPNLSSGNALTHTYRGLGLRQSTLPVPYNSHAR